ncbi:ABC transporter permease [Thalassotalea crassostreae]|uniref:ABC transporter permease n=1 Tax=Thalassotalea crassostreae TaxID=1763536 RepID=UPI000837EFE5|nr:ABC transporter permease [Thalassotalea crassostreae]
MAGIRSRSNIKIWQDVIFALFLREIRSQFNDKFGIGWAIFNPLVFIFVLSFVRSLIGGDFTHTMPTFVFMMYGMLFIQLFILTLNNCTKSINKNKALFAFRQVHPISALIAAALFQFIIIVIVILVLFKIIYLFQMEVSLFDPLSIILYLFLIWCFAMSLGLLFAIGRSFVPEIEKVRGLLQRPMFFISGVFFSLKDIPEEYRVYFSWNPILHAIELSRDAAYPSYQAIDVNLGFISIVTLMFLFFSLACYKVTWKKVLN